jgi:pimeloyl-ACP methyl ester carboxylesterase
VFEGFDDVRVDVGDAVLRVRHSGSDGHPVLLLHGHPRTGATWHRVAARLHAAGYAVVCPDLRGYGRSSTPRTTADPHAARFATAWWHWFFFAQPEKPERVILADSDAWGCPVDHRWAS